jgi:hypothetical protein
VIDMTAPVMFVKLKLAGVATPVTEAVTAYPPAVPLAVNAADVAMPFASVVSVSVAVPFANVPLAPDNGAVNVTVAPLTGYWLLSTTVATRGATNAVSIVASCSDPLVAVMVAAAPDVFVNAKLVEVITPATVAVTVSAPITPLAVKIDEVATPFESVVSVSEEDEFDEKVPLAPVVGAVKTTNAPLTGAPPMVTVATSFAANAVLTAALCGVPLVAAIDSGLGLKFELLQPGNNTKSDTTMISKIELRTLALA